MLFRINKPDVDKDEAQDGDNAETSDDADGLPPASSSNRSAPELYCMEEKCPHLGAPLSHAVLEVDDIEDTRAVGVYGC